MSERGAQLGHVPAGHRSSKLTTDTTQAPSRGLTNINVTESVTLFLGCTTRTSITSNLYHSEEYPSSTQWGGGRRVYTQVATCWRRVGDVGWPHAIRRPATGLPTGASERWLAMVGDGWRHGDSVSANARVSRPVASSQWSAASFPGAKRRIGADRGRQIAWSRVGARDAKVLLGWCRDGH